MARTGVNENKEANQDYKRQGTQAFDTGQKAIDTGAALAEKQRRGEDIAVNPFTRPDYLTNVNKLQSNSLNAADETARAALEDRNLRTGGLNTGAVSSNIKDMALQKMRLADILSAERAANDYRANLSYQQQQLQNAYMPAELESPYYGTATGGRSGSLKNLTDFGIASYGPWNAAIQAAGTAIGAAAAPRPKSA